MNSQNNTSSNGTEQLPLLAVEHLSLSFLQYERGLKESISHVITDFHLTVHKGETVAIVGASGSGKSLLADSILGILPDNATRGGTIKFEGEELTDDKQAELRGKKISLIPQSLKALDPLMQVGKQVQAAVQADEKKVVQQKVFQKLGLPAGTGRKFPYELSGGMARRVLIATAMVSDAKLIIADEPTPGLDEKTRDETIGYVKQLADDGKGVIFITHDINAALQVADRVAVVRAGETIEIAGTKYFSGKGENLKHPYTRALWNALPQNGFTPLKEVHSTDGASTAGVQNRDSRAQRTVASGSD